MLSRQVLLFKELQVVDAFLALAAVELSFEILDLLLKDGNLLSLLFIDLNDVFDLSHVS